MGELPFSCVPSSQGNNKPHLFTAQLSPHGCAVFRKELCVSSFFKVQNHWSRWMDMNSTCLAEFPAQPLSVQIQASIKFPADFCDPLITAGTGRKFNQSLQIQCFLIVSWAKHCPFWLLALQLSVLVALREQRKGMETTTKYQNILSSRYLYVTQSNGSNFKLATWVCLIHGS